MNGLILSLGSFSNCVLHTYSWLLHNGQQEIVFRAKGADVKSFPFTFSLSKRLAHVMKPVVSLKHGPIVKRIVATQYKNYGILQQDGNICFNITKHLFCAALVSQIRVAMLLNNLGRYW
jgi:hypothetical protein